MNKKVTNFFSFITDLEDNLEHLLERLNSSYTGGHHDHEHDYEAHTGDGHVEAEHIEEIHVEEHEGHADDEFEPVSPCYWHNLRFYRMPYSGSWSSLLLHGPFINPSLVLEQRDYMS